MSTPFRNHPVPPSAPPAAPLAPPPIQPVRAVVHPLLPVMLTLVLAAILAGVALAWLFPARPDQAAPAVKFTDITDESGMRFTHRQGGEESPTTLGGGVTVFDYDGDGAPDIFLVNGAPWPWEESLEKRSGHGCALYRNDGRGHFTDVTAAAGLNTELQGMAAVAGDYDGDGRPDLFITCVGSNHLFRNLGQGHFEDMTEEAGVGGEDNTWSIGAAWIDADADSRPDLVVLHYARWLQEVGLAQAFSIADVGRSYGAPTGFLSAFPSVYRNRGDGAFELLPDSAGLRAIDSETGRPVAQPLAVVPVDHNGDGRLDLLVTYHNHAATLYLAQPGGGFVPQSLPAELRSEGTTVSIATSSLLTGRFAAEPRAPILLQFARAISANPDEPTIALNARLALATGDFDLDGQTETYSGQGVAEPRLNRFEGGRDFARMPALLWSDGRTWSAVPGTAPLTARGVATGDFDGDGDLDVVMAQNNGPAVLLRNDQRTGLPWLRLHLIATRSHPEAAGARVEVHTPRHVLTQTVAPVLGFMAQSEATLTFGLGDDARVQRIVIQWPSGQRQEMKPEAINRLIEVREP